MTETCGLGCVSLLMGPHIMIMMISLAILVQALSQDKALRAKLASAVVYPMPADQCMANPNLTMLVAIKHLTQVINCVTGS
jgi:hypothetical protein